ncbi:MAG: type II secretion system protein M [Gammaproteobacteria bacterium]
MRAWWAGLAQNERRLVMLGGVALLVVLFYALIWLPLQKERDRLTEELSAQRENLAWMQTHAAEARALLAKRPSVRPLSGQSLLGLVDRTVRGNRLTETLQRIQPEGNDAVRVWLEAASFDDVSRWLGQLEQRHGIRVESINIERHQAPGRVTVRLTLKSPA